MHLEGAASTSAVIERRTRNALIARSLTSVAALLLATRLLGAARDIAIAYRFGISELVDAYVLVLGFVTWFPALWASILQTLGIPHRVTLAEEQRTRFDAELLGLTLLLGVLAGVACAVVLPAVLAGINSLDTDSRVAVRMLAVTLAPLAAMGIACATLSVDLLARHRPVAPTLLEGIPTLTLLLVLLLWQSAELELFVFGCLLGSALHLASLAGLRVVSKQGFAMRFGMGAERWRPLWGAVVVVALGQLAMSITQPLDQLFAARTTEGSVATLGYANRLLALGLGVLGLAIARTFLPVLSDMAAEASCARSVAWRWASVLIVCGIALAAATYCIAPLLVELLFERGSFDQDDTTRVAQALRWGLLQVPCYAGSIVLIQLLVSQRQHAAIAMIAIAAAAVKVVLSVLLSKSHGVPGIMMASAAMYAVSFVLIVLWTLYEARLKD